MFHSLLNRPDADFAHHITPHARHPARPSPHCEMQTKASSFFQSNAPQPLMQPRFHGHLGPPPGPAHLEFALGPMVVSRTSWIAAGNPGGYSKLGDALDASKSSRQHVPDWLSSRALPSAINAARCSSWLGWASIPDLVCRHHLHHHPTKGCLRARALCFCFCCSCKARARVALALQPMENPPPIHPHRPLLAYLALLSVLAP